MSPADDPILLRLPVRHSLAARLAAWLLAVLALPAQATSTSLVQADATLGLVFDPAAALQVFGEIRDDGTNLFTTYTLFDPFGLPGSGGSALGSVGFPTGTSVALSARSEVRTQGAPAPISEIGLAQTTVDGGFVLVNGSNTFIDVTLQLAWAWEIAFDVESPALESALGQVFLDLYVDGNLERSVEAVSLATPPGGTQPAGQSLLTLTLDPAATRSVHLALTTLAFSQASLPTALPEPGSMALAALAVLVLLRRRRADA